MHAIIADNDNLIVFTDNEGRVVDCFEYQRLSFIDSLKYLFRKVEQNEDLRSTLEKVRNQR